MSRSSTDDRGVSCIIMQYILYISTIADCKISIEYSVFYSIKNCALNFFFVQPQSILLLKIFENRVPENKIKSENRITTII